MKQSNKVWKRKAVATAVLGCFAGSVAAVQIDTESGWSGSWTTTLSAGASWRMEDQDKDLVPRNAAQFGMVQSDPSAHPATGASKNVGNLNYDKGDMYSEVYRFLTELRLSRGDTALLISAKGWYDRELEDGNVPWGNMAAWGGTRPGADPATSWDKPLSDAGAPTLSRFSGVYLLDAYVSQDLEIGGILSQVRLGRQVINWGEGLFIRGMNLHNAIDVSAARRAGSEIKEALLPTFALQASADLANGMNVEGFYQLVWEPSAIEYCGTYWNPAHATIDAKPGGCNVLEAAALGATGNVATMEGPIAAIAQTEGEEPSKAGAWGLALRFPVESIDTEIGIYAMNVSAALPAVTARGQVGPSGFVSLAGNAGVPGIEPATMQFNYFDNIRVFGVSAASNILGWSVGAELSRHQGIPVNYYAEDMKNSLGTEGPLRDQFLQQFAGREGQVVSFDFYERFNKTQFTFNAVNTLNGIASALGATQAVLLGEVGFEWNNVPDFKKAGNPRFGRNGPAARSPSITSSDPCADTGSRHWCKNDGFVTDFSWGYRLRGQLTYSSLFGTGWEFKPTLFFAHDVEGVSLDGQFQEDRQTLGLDLAFSLDKQHTINLNYTRYGGKWNLFRDHDNLGVAYSYKF